MNTSLMKTINGWMKTASTEELELVYEALHVELMERDFTQKLSRSSNPESLL